MSEGLEVLRYINSHGGCLLSELSVQMGVPVTSLHGWVEMLCSTGYLKKSEQPDHGDCPCATRGSHCVACRCSCKAVKEGNPMRFEMTERGMAMVRRGIDEINKDEVVPDYGRLPRSNFCSE